MTEDSDFRALIKVEDTVNMAFETNNGLQNFQFPQRGADESEAVVAKVGDPIGPAGKITKILEDRVETRQYTIEADGTRKYEDVYLYMGNPLERQKVSEKRTIILGPGGEKIIRVESDLAGIGGGTRYLDGVTGADITAQYLIKLKEESKEKIGL